MDGSRQAGPGGAANGRGEAMKQVLGAFENQENNLDKEPLRDYAPSPRSAKRGEQWPYTEGMLSLGVAWRDHPGYHLSAKSAFNVHAQFPAGTFQSCLPHDAFTWLHEAFPIWF